MVSFVAYNLLEINVSLRGPLGQTLASMLKLSPPFSPQTALLKILILNHDITAYYLETHGVRKVRLHGISFSVCARLSTRANV